MAKTKQQLQVENTTNFPNNNTNYITPALLREFNSDMIISMVDEIPFAEYTQSVAVSLDNLNAFSSSALTSISNLNTATASLNTSASLGLVTASFDNGTRNLTFTKGNNAQFSVNIPDVSGSAGNFVTTSSFNAYTASTDSSISQLNASSASQQVSIDALNTNSASVNVSITNLNSTTQSLQSQLATIGGQSGSWITESETGSFATTGSNTFTGAQTINADLTVSGSTNVGFLNVADLGGINFAASGSGAVTSYGIVTNPSNGDLVFNTNPGNGRLMTFNQTNGVMNAWNGMKLDTSFIGIDVYDHPLNLSSSYGGMTTMLNTQGNVVVSGSLITSGSLIVGGVQSINYTSGSGIGEVYLLSRSGSLVLTNSTYTPTYASLSHLSSSGANLNTNLIFKNSSAQGDTIISGSNNIFTSPAGVTAGFKRYIGGSQNYFGATLPQITGSAGFSPTFTGNIINSGFIMRTPVSSSTYTVSGNLILNPGATAISLGTSAGNNFERAVSGLAMSNNIVNGTVNAIASKTPLSASISINNNNIGGQINLNMDSSSINLSGTNIQGSLTVNNSYFPSTLNPNSSLGISTGLFIGQHTIFASGSNATFTAPRAVANTSLIGSQNVISASLNGDNTNVACTTLIGQGLVAVGTNTRQAGATMPDYGTVFVGRFNSIDGVKDQTAETVFAVGTGTAEATRKTGFLIDSGSNSFFEGTLNVSGSTSLTGSLTIQSGSGFFANGNRQFNVGAFQSNVSQSGSANVSQSMNFETTDISSGVSIASNSRITLANAGTYNIQFSAQLLADTGADDVWIWLKKNGTNVAASAGHVVLANNEEVIAAWNYVVDAAAADYFEIVWQSANGDAILLTETATGNIPSVPSVILTVTQVR